MIKVLSIPLTFKLSRDEQEDAQHSKAVLETVDGRRVEKRLLAHSTIEELSNYLDEGYELFDSGNYADDDGTYWLQFLYKPNDEDTPIPFQVTENGKKALSRMTLAVVKAMADEKVVAS